MVLTKGVEDMQAVYARVSKIIVETLFREAAMIVERVVVLETIHVSHGSSIGSRRDIQMAAQQALHLSDGGITGSRKNVQS